MGGSYLTFNLQEWSNFINKYRMAKALGKALTLTANIVTGAPGYLAPRLKGVMFYARSEMMPPKPSEFGEVAIRVGRTIKNTTTFQWRNYTMKEILVKGLVSAEVACWFFVGECIGKGQLVGYTPTGGSVLAHH